MGISPSIFGLVCWADDDELKQQFKNSSGVEVIQFGELSLDDKQMLHERVTSLMNLLGIPAISKVVYREAILYGTGDNRKIASLISQFLPYMQRYIYKVHRETYNNFQQNEAIKLSNLEVTVVKKLSHKYKVKGCDSSSKRIFKCPCLLQGNILYATREADSHSVFLELSRLFFDGSVDLHFANFLHMVKAMVDSGSTVEQIEFFIVNSQKMPELPQHEFVWSSPFLFAAEEVFTSQTDQSQPVSESNHIPKHQSNPVRDLSTSDRAKQEKDVNDVRSLSVFSKLVECEHTENTPVSVKHGKALVVKEDLVAESIVDGSTKAIDEPDNLDLVNGDEPANLLFGTGNLPSQIDEIELIDTGAELADVVEEKDNLDTGSPNGSHSRVVKPDEAMVQKPDEKLRTGRLGEAAVHQYLVGQLGSSNVKWE